MINRKSSFFSSEKKCTKTVKTERFRYLRHLKSFHSFKNSNFGKLFWGLITTVHLIEGTFKNAFQILDSLFK